MEFNEKLKPGILRCIVLEEPKKTLKIKYIIKSESKGHYFSYDKKRGNENQSYTFKRISKLQDVVIFDTKEDAMSTYEEFFGKWHFDRYVPVILEIIVSE